MTARPERRRRRTWFGFASGIVLVVVAAVLVAVAVVTLSNSTEGSAVEVDTRPVEVLPVTPNGALAVVGSDGELASLVVMTLLPEGQGGSIVTVPVNADVGMGLNDEPVPLSSLFDAAKPEEFSDALAGMLSIAVERIAVVDAESLIPLIEPVAPADVDLPADIIDSGTFGSGIVVPSGEQALRIGLIAEGLSAINQLPPVYEQHRLDVALWSGLAANAPVPAGDPPTDALGQPVPPATMDELIERLWGGPVAVRDLDLVAVVGTNDEEAVIDDTVPDVPDTNDVVIGVPSTTPSTTIAGPDESAGTDFVDVVIVDRRDSFLVFAQVSPALVSTSSPGLSFRLEVGFSEEQLADSDDLFVSNSEAARRLIGEILFFQGNVVSVDTAEINGGAPQVSLVEVADERFLDDVKEFAPILFGESEVVLADTVLEGVDVVVTVGTGYIDFRNDS